jgi:potassium efflux system protein
VRREAFLWVTLMCSLSEVFAQTVPDVQTENRTVAEGNTDGQASLEELREKRAHTESELQAISRPETLGAGAPADTPRDELLERRTRLHLIVRSLDEQIDETLRWEQTRRRRSEVSKSQTEPHDHAESPPYSIFFADQLWDAAYSLRLTVEGLQSQLNLIELRSNRARESLMTAEEKLRQASERAESAKGLSSADRERWHRDLEALRQRAAAAMLQAAELSKTRLQEELNDARARLEAAERHLESVEAQVAFTEADLRTIGKRLSDELHNVSEELERTTPARRRQFDELRNTEQELATRLAKRKDQNRKLPENLRGMQAAAEAERIQADNLALKADLLQLMLDVVEGERQLWESRFLIAHGAEPGKAREAYDRFTPLFTNFSASRDYLRQQVGIVSGQIGELETRVNNTKNAREREHVKVLLQAHRQRQLIYERALQRVDQASRFLERWRSEFKQQRKELPLSARIEDWWDHAWEKIKVAWQFEVFAAEDTIEVDDKKITGRRSVTVGKIVSALIIFLVGYWLCQYLAGLIGRLAIARLGVAPDLANLLRQWSQAFLITILIVVSFLWVKIPLTIFAFLGGAFAIGAGFGAQNLLKNVISGILLLIERPLRVGDLIEVDNVRGRVTNIGLRSSAVRDAKGMITLIPNSSFLERHLTNWTYSSRIGRFSLRVGAPYGSPAQQVMELLAGLAKENSHVLKTPQPQILLEEFGSQARIFTLNYWLEIRFDIDPNEVASELRFAIERKFEEAGLKILAAA